MPEFNQGYGGAFGQGMTPPTRFQTQAQDRISSLETELAAARGAPSSTGTFHGLGFDRGTLGGELNNPLPSVVNRFESAAGNVIGGSRAAEGLLRGAFDDLFTARAEGIQGEQDELERSLGALARSQGYSQELVDLLGQQSGIRAQGRLAETQGETQAALGQILAQLVKGTGTELAGIDQAVAQSLLEAELGQLSADAARDAADKDFLGSAIGAAFSLFG